MANENSLGGQAVRNGLTHRLTHIVVAPVMAQVVFMGLAGQFQSSQRRTQMASFVERHPEASAAIGEYLNRVYDGGFTQLAIGLAFTMLAGAFAAWLAWRTANEVHELKRAAERIASGNLDDGPISAGASREIDELSRSVQEMREGLRAKVRLEMDAGALARDRDLADATHLLFLPGDEPFHWEGAVIAGERYAPEGGGRSFWQRKVLKDGRLLVVIGAGAVGGTAGAMVASVVSTCVRVHAWNAHFDEQRFLQSLERALGESSHGEGVALDILLLDASARHAVLLSAGGLGALVTDDSGPRRVIGGGYPLCLGNTTWSREVIALSGVQEISLGTSREHSGVLSRTPSNDASSLCISFARAA